jgi:CheY-like chemotaxis protein
MIDHCLIIDNNITRSSELQKILKDGNISASIKHTLNCGHGLVYLKEVWNKIHNHNTVVILNVNTPIMNGWEFLEVLKDTPYNDKLTIVAMSDTLDESDKVTYEKKGIKKFISSPFSLEAISTIAKADSHIENCTPKSESGIEKQADFKVKKNKRK